MSSIQIIVGSMLGNSEYTAEAAANVLSNAGHEVNLHTRPKFADIAQQGQIWLVCTSTHGTGELPDNIKSFAEDLENSNVDLSDLKYVIIGLGDSGYDSFCQGAVIMEQILESKGAQKLLDKLLIDMRNAPDSEEIAENWVENNIAAFSEAAA